MVRINIFRKFETDVAETVTVTTETPETEQVEATAVIPQVNIIFTS